MIRVIITTDVFKWVEQIYSLPLFLRDVTRIMYCQLFFHLRRKRWQYIMTTDTKDVFWGLWTRIQYRDDLGIVEMLFIVIRRSDGKLDKGFAKFYKDSIKSFDISRSLSISQQDLYSVKSSLDYISQSFSVSQNFTGNEPFQKEFIGNLEFPYAWIFRPCSTWSFELTVLTNRKLFSLKVWAMLYTSLQYWQVVMDPNFLCKITAKELFTEWFFYGIRTFIFKSVTLFI